MVLVVGNHTRIAWRKVLIEYNVRDRPDARTTSPSKILSHRIGAKPTELPQLTMTAAVKPQNQVRVGCLNCVHVWQQGTNGQATTAHVRQIWGRGSEPFPFGVHVCEV